MLTAETRGVLVADGVDDSHQWVGKGGTALADNQKETAVLGRHNGGRLHEDALVAGLEVVRVYLVTTEEA